MLIGISQAIFSIPFPSINAKLDTEFGGSEEFYLFSRTFAGSLQRDDLLMAYPGGLSTTGMLHIVRRRKCTPRRAFACALRTRQKDEGEREEGHPKEKSSSRAGEKSYAWNWLVVNVF